MNCDWWLVTIDFLMANVRKSDCAKTVTGKSNPCMHQIVAVNIRRLQTYVCDNPEFRLGGCTKCERTSLNRAMDEPQILAQDVVRPWMCLQCCHFGCGRNVHRHAQLHFLEYGLHHSLSVDTSNLSLIWCYTCNGSVSTISTVLLDLLMDMNEIFSYNSSLASSQSHPATDPVMVKTAFHRVKIEDELRHEQRRSNVKVQKDIDSVLNQAMLHLDSNGDDGSKGQVSIDIPVNKPVKEPAILKHLKPASSKVVPSQNAVSHATTNHEPVLQQPNKIVPKDFVKAIYLELEQKGWISDLVGCVSIVLDDMIYFSSFNKVKPEHLNSINSHLDLLQLNLHDELPKTVDDQLNPYAAKMQHMFRVRPQQTVAIFSQSKNAVLLSFVVNESKFRCSRIEMMCGIPNVGAERLFRFDEVLEIPIIPNDGQSGGYMLDFIRVLAVYPRTSAIIVKGTGVYVWGESWNQCRRIADCLEYIFELALLSRLHKVSLK